MNGPCRLIVDGPADGAWNMAVDEALLLAAIEQPGGAPTFRWYRWSTATLSVGYFQNLADRPESLAGLPCVR
ncbi:MAG: hypothetical protein ACRDD1_10965, partial [Planctomycetia bacterium]